MAAAGHPLVGDPLYGPGGVPKGGHNTAAGLAGASGDSTAGGAEAATAGAAGDGNSSDEKGRPAVVVPGDCGYLLHCMLMEFGHPVTQERLRIISPSPPELE